MGHRMLRTPAFSSLALRALSYCLLLGGLLLWPEIGHASPRPAPTVGVVKRTLPNGLRVLVLPRHTAPVVTTMLWYRVGSRDEVPGSTGIAHFLEHLLFKGTRKLPKGEIDRLTFRHGGSNNAFTFNDYTAYEFHFPKRHWKVALQIEADRMRNCVFDPKELESERQVVMEERREGEDDPVQQLGEQLNAMSFLSHPYRNPVIGWMEDLRRVTRNEIMAFYRKYYVPANATLVVTGDVTPAEAMVAVRSAFMMVPAAPAPRRSAVKEPPQIGERRLTLAQPTQVSRLQVLLPSPTRPGPDVYPLNLLLYVLTEGKQSRLYRRLVDTDRLAVETDGGLGTYRDAGQIFLYATAGEGVPLERLETVLWEELQRAAREPVTPQELERAKKQAYSDWIHGLETTGDLANVLGEADALGGYQYVDAWLPGLRKVTAADLQRVAAAYLRRERATVGHLIPDGKKTARVGTGGQPGVVAAAGRGLPEVWPRLGTKRPVRLAGQSQSGPVSAGPPVSFTSLRPVEKVLPNGLRLVLLENHVLPSVVLSARVDAGSYQDPPSKAGLAAVVGAMLEEGTHTQNHDRISATLEQVGASFEASPGRTSTYLNLQVLSDHARSLLPIFAEMVRNPAFPTDRLELVRSQVLSGIQEQQDDASGVARQAFNALVYGDHPAGRPHDGTGASVRSLQPEDLRGFHARHYRPERTTLVVVGDFRAAEWVRELEAVFGTWARGSSTGASRLPPVERQQDVRVRRIPMAKAQTQIVLGHLGVSRKNPDYLALRVLDTILGEGVGGGFTARIPYQLRDVQGLAYGVGSSITSTAGAGPGVFVAVLGTEPAREKEAITALLKEIRRIRSAPVSTTELREAIDYLMYSYVFAFQTNGQLAEYLHAVHSYGLGYDYRQRFLREVARVTREDVQRVARKYLDPKHYSLVVVGPGQSEEE